jgi:hydrogenase maturation factor
LLIKKIIIIYRKINLNCILKELSYLDFVFITNVGFAVYNNILDKEDLDEILSNNRKGIYMLMFHMH